MYNVPILTPEDRTQQPIDTSDDYSKAYRSPISTDIDGPNSKYWIEFVEKKAHGGEELYNAYKGSFSNKRERIMTLSLGTAATLCTARDKEIPHLELCYTGYTGKYNIKNQEEELGKVDVSYGWIRYDPLFEVILTSSCFLRSYIIMGFLIFNGIFAGISILVSLGIILITFNHEFQYTEVPIKISVVSTSLAFILYWWYCFCPCCKKNAVKRFYRIDVEDKKTRKLVAQIHNLRGVCFSHEKDLEITCYRKLTMPQLMGLLSLGVLSLTKEFILKPSGYSYYL